MEGWLMLVLFVMVAVLLVDRIQAGLAQAHTRAREALLLFELSRALVGRQSRAEIAATVAERLQQLGQAAQVQVALLLEDTPLGGERAVLARVPNQTAPAARPDHVVSLLAARRLVSEIPCGTASGVSTTMPSGSCDCWLVE